MILGLGLESSCDETAASIIADGRCVLSNRISSQIDLHKAYNGVVPEIASRAHLEVINVLVDEALAEAKISFSDLKYVAATSHPGLVGSLLVAVQSAKAVACACDIPFIPVNHLEAHLHAATIEHEDLAYPYIGLLVSGGNTVLCLVHSVGDMRLLGRTSDDAVGEAYDKVSKLLGLGYPGGPVIDAIACTASVRKNIFPKLLVKYDDYSFSYSGLKTAVLTRLKEYPDSNAAEIAWAFQESALEILVRRTFAAARDYSVKKIVVAGGVASNSRLRELFAAEKTGDEKVYFPSPVLCTDNAAMVASLGYAYFMRGDNFALDTDVSARYTFTQAV